MYDELWDTPRGGARSWYESTLPELRTFCDTLVERIIERGGEPNWNAVNRFVEDNWPNQAPSCNVVKDNVRRLVRARSK